MGQLFQKIELVEDGRIEFQFSIMQHHIFWTTTKLLHVEGKENSQWLNRSTWDYVEVNRG